MLESGNVGLVRVVQTVVRLCPFTMIGRIPKLLIQMDTRVLLGFLRDCSFCRGHQPLIRH